MPMATASQEELPGGEAGAAGEEKLERERADAEARQLSDRDLREKAQRTQEMFAGVIADRLPDRGKKLRLSFDAMHRELSHRLARGGGTLGQGGDRCERIVQSRCAESCDTMKANHRHQMDQVGRKSSSGLTSDPNKAKLSKADFQFSFGLTEKADVDISSLEITTRSQNEPNTALKNEGKLHEEEDSCKPSSQRTDLIHEELHACTSTNMKKVSSDDASNKNGHDRMCEAAPTPSRKRKGADPANFSMRLRSRKEEVVLLDGDTSHQESAEEASNNQDAKKLYYPSREHPNSIEISSDDIRCLQPESLLSSPIMNFYIMYLQGPTSSIVRPRGEYHIFNTYFFSKLEAMTSKEDKTNYFLKLRRWWKGVDIFEKAYILLPVHAEFLKEEWNYLNENVSSAECLLHETVWKNFPRKIEKKPVEVPQQENDYDCGLFVLYYMQRFICAAPKRLQKKDLSMFGKRWFQPEEPSQLRCEIRLLHRKCREAKPHATELLGEPEPKNGVTDLTTSEHLPEAVNAAKETAFIEVEEASRRD